MSYSSYFLNNEDSTNKYMGLICIPPKKEKKKRKNYSEDSIDNECISKKQEKNPNAYYNSR